MKDEAFLEKNIDRLKEARTFASREFNGLSGQQLNWKASPTDWSIGQCLDHLIVSDLQYFPALKQISDGHFKMSGWQRWSPFSGLFGRMLISQTQEQPVTKVKSPKIFLPDSNTIDPGVLDRFLKHIDTLIEYISFFRREDLDRTKISSPVSAIVTLSLRNAITLLVQHEYRHINQAIRIKKSGDFVG